jgi:hypothetical protein
MKACNEAQKMAQFCTSADQCADQPLRIRLVHRLLILAPITLGSSTDGGGLMAPEPNHASDEVLRRVQGEFIDMPLLRLTEAQARRLWGLDAQSCDALLETLVGEKFLFRTRDGAFMRVEHAEPVKAPLKPRTRVVAA